MLMFLLKSILITNIEIKIMRKQKLFFFDVEKKNVCLNIDVDFFLKNCDFCKKQTFNVFIRTITTLFKIRDFNIKIHEIFKYIIDDVYFKKNKKRQKDYVCYLSRTLFN